RMQRSAVAAREAIEATSAQLEGLREQIEKGGESGYMANWEGSRARVVAVADSVDALQREIGRALGSADRLAGAIGGHTSLPTADQMRQLEWAHEDLTRAIERLNRLLGSEVPALLTSLRDEGSWPIRVPAIAPPARGGQ